jgi:hypothetical protein
MGYNTLVTIKGKDLDAIANDPEFGANLKSTIRMSGAPLDLGQTVLNGSGLWMSDFFSGSGLPLPGYDAQVAIPHHADHRSVHSLIDGVFWTLGQTQEFTPYEALAEKLADLEVTTSMKSHKFLVPARKSAPLSEAMQDELSAMNDYDLDTLATSTISLVVINDYLGHMDTDKTLGRRIRDGILSWWKQTAEANRALVSKPEDARFSSVYASIPCGSILGVTPANCSDVLMVSGNCGNKFQSRPSVDEIIRLNNQDDFVTKSRESDLHTAKMEMLETGFHVRMPGRTRAESPMVWSQHRWVTPTSQSEQTVEQSEPAVSQII